MNEPISIAECCDNMDFMRQFPDKFFDLAIVDPPYGIGKNGHKNDTRGKLAIAKSYKPFYGNDKESPSSNYFNELFRISKNQIIWGANHFISKMPFDSHCWIIWDKQNGNSDYADCELAFTSFKTAARKFQFRWSGMLQGNMKNKENRIHPTQKPVALYSWLLKNYAKLNNKILDTHLGSQSSRIAAYKLGFDFWGCEIDPDYFKDGCARFDRECSGIIEAKNGSKIIQQKLFV